MTGPVLIVVNLPDAALAPVSRFRSSDRQRLKSGALEACNACLAPLFRCLQVICCERAAGSGQSCALNRSKMLETAMIRSLRPSAVPGLLAGSGSRALRERLATPAGPR